jgi:type III secretion system ATPase, FliI/YscN (EC 3.6.3.15)
LINIGAYKSGSNSDIDYAISKIKKVNEYLMQETYDKYDFEQEIAMLKEIFDKE